MAGHAINAAAFTTLPVRVVGMSYSDSANRLASDLFHLLASVDEHQPYALKNAGVGKVTGCQ
jgi:hypothetical protein